MWRFVENITEGIVANSPEGFLGEILDRILRGSSDGFDEKILKIPLSKIWRNSKKNLNCGWIAESNLEGIWKEFL